MANQRLNIDIVANDKSKQAFNSLQGNIGKTQSTLLSLKNILLAVAGSVIIRQLGSLTNQFQNLENKLRTVTSSTQELNKVQLALFAIAQNTRAGFANTVETFKQLSQETDNLNVSNEQLLLVTENINKLVRISGVSADSAGEAIKRLSQAFSLGALQGSDFKALTKTMPALLDLLSKSLGVTKKELKEMAKEGKITSQMLFETIMNNSSAISEQNNKIKLTMVEANQQLGNTFLNLVGTFDKVSGASGAYARSIQSLSNFLKENANFFDLLAVNVKALAKEIRDVLIVAVDILVKTFKFLKKNIDIIIVALKSLIALKIAMMFHSAGLMVASMASALIGIIPKIIAFARTLIPVIAGLTTINSLSLVGLPLVAASAIAGGVAYGLMTKQVNEAEQSVKDINNEFTRSQNLFGTPFDNPYIGISDTINPDPNKNKTEKNTFEKFSLAQLHFNEESMKAKDLHNQILEKLKLQNKEYSLSTEVFNLLNSSVASFSRSFAEAVVLGKSLNMSFKEFAQNIMVDVLAKMIERFALLSLEKILIGDNTTAEEAHLSTLKKITSELKKQAIIRTILLFLGGGGGGSPSGHQPNIHAGKASGGAVAKGQSYMVGERGAELFTPNETGQISQSARGNNRGSTTVNFNINTVDASGFNDLLIRSRGTITQLINNAVNERGSRSII